MEQLWACYCWRCRGTSIDQPSGRSWVLFITKTGTLVGYQRPDDFFSSLFNSLFLNIVLSRLYPLFRSLCKRKKIQIRMDYTSKHNLPKQPGLCGSHDTDYFCSCIVGCRSLDVESLARAHQLRSSQYNRAGGGRILQGVRRISGVCLSGGAHRSSGAHHLGNR